MGAQVVDGEVWLRKAAVAALWKCAPNTVPVWADSEGVQTRRTGGGPTGRFETRYLAEDVERVGRKLDAGYKPRQAIPPPTPTPDDREELAALLDELGPNDVAAVLGVVRRLAVSAETIAVVSDPELMEALGDPEIAVEGLDAIRELLRERTARERGEVPPPDSVTGPVEQ